MRTRNVLAASAALLAVISIAAGCGKKESGESEVVAYVNKDPIYRSDVAAGLALMSKMDPSLEINKDTEKQELNLLINRKLIIQEAMAKGLAEQERFINTIKAFWEQTLIRDFVDYKKREFDKYLFASPSEIKKYYGQLSYRVTFRVLAAADRKELEGPYKAYTATGDYSAWQEVGPARYEDLVSGAFIAAFDMKEGEAGIFSDEKGSYLIAVAGRSRVEIEPLEVLKPDIERRIIAAKEKKFFEDWLENKRKNSDIKIPAR